MTPLDESRAWVAASHIPGLSADQRAYDHASKRDSVDMAIEMNMDRGLRDLGRAADSLAVNLDRLNRYRATSRRARLLALIFAALMVGLAGVALLAWGWS